MFPFMSNVFNVQYRMKMFQNNLGKFSFLCSVDRLFVCVSETLRDEEYRQYEKIIKISWVSETKHFIVCQLNLFMEKITCESASRV